ncbi:MAG: hypothetical protein ABIP35_12560 [Ginsengibacter sp.]
MKILLLFFLLPFQLFAQSSLPEGKDLAGVWTGSLYNDTTQKYIHYELAINETNGKFNGYSHTTFIIDSVKNIGVKEVKIKIKKGVVSVEDDKLIDNDYTAPPAKGVRTFIDLAFSENDSTEILEGTWKTNRTKEYNAITGSIRLERTKKFRQTLIIPKLEQLGLAGNLSFLNRDKLSETSVAIAEKKKQTDSKNAATEKSSSSIISGTTAATEIIPDTTITDPELVVKIYGPIKKKAVTTSDSTNTSVANNNAAKDTEVPKGNSLQKQIVENKNKTVSNSAEGKNEIAKNIINLKPATPDSNVISSKSKKDEISNSEQELVINKPLPSQNKTAPTKDLAIKEEKEILKDESKTKSEKQKTEPVSAVDGRKQLTEINKNNQEKLVATVDNKYAEKKEENIKNSGLLKNETESTAVKNVAALPTQSKPIADSNMVNKKKNEIARSGVIENQPTNAQEKEVVKISQSKRQTDVNQKETSSTQEIEKNKIPGREVVKASGNQGQTENVQSAINPLSKKIITNAAEILKREIETIRTVEVTQDSLVLSLYDNGTVDGDTVSILINGIVVMPKVGLLAKAVNKTIYLTPEMGDSINVIMYAENLGSFPPNTGLLIVRDGDINYEIRFSGDLKKNSAIILKRKKSKIEN